MPTMWANRLKLWTSRQFYWFGLYCAKHTMMVLLSCGVVITVLVYPALAIQLDAQPAARLTTRLSDAWLFSSSSYYRNSIDSPTHTPPPVREFWEGHPALHPRDDATVVARCGLQTTVALERLFVRGYGAAGNDSSAQPILGPVSALVETERMQRTLEHALGDSQSASSQTQQLLECVRNAATGSCFVLSPFAPASDPDSGADPDYSPTAAPPSSSVLDEESFLLALSNPQPIAGIPLHPASLVAGHTNPSDVLSDPEYLVLTFALKADDCQSTARHHKWIEAVRRAAGSNGLVTPTLSLPDLIALQYDPSGSQSRFSRFSALIYLSYVIVFIHFSGSLRRMDTVHDRYGMAFTGIVEIIMSTLCSISVCEIIGFRLNMVPREILPVVIVFVGAENMFTMVEDVVATKITLPVKERIGIGLSRSGTSNTIKVVSYNALLGTIAFFSTGAIHQFCVFAIVVLVIHWIIINTMFIGVLAIDLHRLELSDHLSQNTMLKSSNDSIAPDPSLTATSAKTKAPKKAASTGSNGFRGTAATNGSLLLLFAVVGALYYATYTGHKDDLAPLTQLPGDRSLRTASTGPKADAQDPAARIWQLLNPNDDQFLHIKVEPPIFVTFSPDGTPARSQHPGAERSRSTARLMSRILNPLIHLSKTIILPVFITNFLLWLILSFLMQDKELSEAQRHREDGDDIALVSGGGAGAGGDRVPPLPAGVSFKSLERACAYDIMLVASSSDASVIASISTEYELAVWFDRDGRHITINCAPLIKAAGLLLPSVGAPESTSRTQSRRRTTPAVTHLTLDSRGAWCAIATDSGLLIVWSLAKGAAALQSRAQLPPSGIGAAFRNIAFAKTASPSMSRSTSVSSINDAPAVSSRMSAVSNKVSLIITDAQGLVYTWAFLTSPRPVHSTPQSPSESPRGSIGSIGEFSFGTSTLGGSVSLRGSNAGNEMGESIHLCAKRVPVRGEMLLAVVSVLPTQHVVVSDSATGEVICTVDEQHDHVDRARLGTLDARPCRTCSGTKPSALVLALSSRGTVHVYHIPFPTAEGSLCSCGQTDLFDQPYANGSSVRSRRSSYNAAAPPTPAVKMRRKTSSVSSSTATSQDSPPRTSADGNYPMYGHGAHRREKTRDFDGSSEQQSFLVPPPPMANGEQSVETVKVPQKVVKVTSIACDRGGWDLCKDGLLIGVRKRARPALRPTRALDSYVAQLRGEAPVQAAGPSRKPSPYDGWEVWSADVTGTVRASSLTDLPPIAKGLVSIDEGFANGLFFHPPPSMSPRLSESSLDTPLSSPGSMTTEHPTPPVRVYPRIPFTRASCFSSSTPAPSSTAGEHFLIGFGNTAVLVRVSPSASSALSASEHSTPSRQQSGSLSNSSSWSAFLS